MATILAMSKIAETRDDDTGKHIERIQTFCRILATKMQERSVYGDSLSDTYIENLSHASPLHDIGKVAIPDGVLLKAGKLNEEEFKIIQTHTTVGAQTLEAVRGKYPRNAFVNMGIAVARSHHEKWDGSGYPDGQSGEDIPLCARILAVADVYDALRSKRCYKPAFSHEKSRDIILRDSGKHFAPNVVEVFMEVEEEFDDIRVRMEG